MEKKTGRYGCGFRIIALLLLFSIFFGLIGTVEIKAEDPNRYVVLVVDTSGDSDFYDGNLETILYKAYSPIDEIKQAALIFIQNLSSAGKTKVAVVSYNDSAKVISSFTNDYEQLESKIQRLSKAGGRKNMDAGLNMAKQLLDGVAFGTEKTVIIVSPGMTDEGEHSRVGHWSRESEGSTWKNTDSGIHLYEYANSVYDTASEIKAQGAKIYTIGLIKAMENCPPAVSSAAALFKSVLEDIASDGCCFPVEDVNEFEIIFEEMSQNVTKGKKGTFEFAATDEKFDYSSTYYYEDAYFDKNAEEYDCCLATMSLCLAISAFGVNGASLKEDYYTPEEAIKNPISGNYWWPNGVITKDNVYKNQWSNVENLLKELGFDCIEKNDDFKTEPGTDTIGVIAGLKTVRTDNGDYTLIALATRGGNYFSEWAGNFNIGVSGNHQGFETAKNTAKKFLNDYIEQKDSYIHGTVKMWMAGYSRGGAVVNLLAGDITTSKTIGNGGYKRSILPQNVFAYCFEPPRGLSTQVCSIEQAKTYKNIHNIVNPNDIVPLVAMEEWGFIRYGVDHKYIPDPQYTSTYNKAAANRMVYYQTFDTQAVKDSYVSLKEYEKHIDEVVEKAKAKFRSDYTVYPINHWNDDMERTWYRISARLKSGERIFECDGFTIDATKFEGYGIYENLYEYIIGIQQMRKLVKNYDSYNPYDGRLTDIVSRIDLFRKCRLPDTFTTVKGLLAATDHEYVSEYEITNMADNNLAIVNRIATVYNQRTQYVEEVQSGLSHIIELVKKKNSPLQGKKIDLIEAIGGNDRKILAGLELIFENNAKRNIGIMFENIIKYLKKQGVDIDEYLTETEQKKFKRGLVNLLGLVIESTYTQDGTDDLYSLIKNADLIEMAHYPELCLAWLQSQDPNYSKDNKRIYVPSAKRILVINCPVDVEVFDSSEEMVAGIKDDIPQIIPGSSIACSYTIESGKKICLPLDEEYRAVIKATDSGKMDISINVIGMDGKCRYIENYYDIILHTGETFTINLPKNFMVDEEGNVFEEITGASVENTDGVIEASTILEGDDADKAKYKIDIETSNENGGICVGGGEYSLGSYAMVRAAEYEDCSFIGWYEGEELISEDREYRFRVMNDRSLTARFEGETKYGHNGVFVAQMSAEDGGFVKGDNTITALDGYAFGIEAVPYEGYEFDGWIAEGNCIIEDITQEFTTLTLIDEDITVTAKFIKKQKEEEIQNQQGNYNEGRDGEYSIVTDGIVISYETETEWNGGYNGKITIYNNTGKDLNEWKLDFNMSNVITNIWNAELIDYCDGKNTVKDVGWNTNIIAGTSISFGFTVAGEQVLEPTGLIFAVKKEKHNDNGCSIEFVKTSEWTGGCNGEIVIKNNSDYPITDWLLKFTCDSMINGLWNGVLESYSGNTYIVKNAGYNYVIAPHESVRIGVNLSLQGNDVPWNFILTGK